jgi:hypothetical protein
LLAWKAMVRLLTLSGLILLLAAPAASAGTREKILRECQEGSITGDYTPKQLRDARKHIPTDIDEYSDCRDVLAQAALTGRGGSSNGGAGSNAPGGVVPQGGRSPLTSADPGETAALDDARLNSDRLSIGEQSVIPGAAGFATDAERHGLPTTVLVVLILLALCASAATFASVRRRVLARKQR